MPRFVIPDPAAVNPDTPIRLEVAAALAFPDQSMTARALRIEIDKGRLKGWRMGGRVYTTLAAVADMQNATAIAPKRRYGLALGSQPPLQGADAAARLRLEQTIAEIKAKKRGATEA